VYHEFLDSFELCMDSSSIVRSLALTGTVASVTSSVSVPLPPDVVTSSQWGKFALRVPAHTTARVRMRFRYHETRGCRRRECCVAACGCVARQTQVKVEAN
jgi:hypothetical protein